MCNGYQWGIALMMQADRAKKKQKTLSKSKLTLSYGGVCAPYGLH